MSASQARSISTNQLTVHEDLPKILAKHKANSFRRPIAEHTALAFSNMIMWLGSWQGDIIIDAGCGVGESTINIAAKYPNAKVIGVDKSTARLDKHSSYSRLINSQNNQDLPTLFTTNNYVLLQADLNDFWRLLARYISVNKPLWHITKQFILYPNPYPKKAQLGKRWHGSALFPTIVGICPNIEVRSNWRLYLEECLVAAQFYELSGSIHNIVDTGQMAYTPFERKYLASHQACFKLVIRP